MFSALYRLTQYILGADNTDQDGDVKEASKGESGQCHGLGGTSQSGDGVEYVSFSGKVTSVFSHYAMINDTIYCAFEVIFGGRHPHIGDQVKGQARRPHDDAGWRATQLTVLDEPCWDEPTPTSDSSAPPDGQRVDDDTWRHLSSTDSGAHAADDDDGEPRELIGQVTSADPLGGAIEGGVAYAASVCAGFGAGPPVVGDWVRATATRGGATCVAPLRRRAYEGKVTFVRGSSARVDDEVAAEATTTCEVGGRLRVGDEVGGLAVESSQGRLTWRAISMNRISSSNHDRPGIVVTTTPLKKSFLGELLRNKEGVTVTSPLEFGTVELGRTVYLTAWIQNEGSTEQMLLRCRVTTTLTQLTIDSPKIISTDPKQVEVLAQEDGIALLPGGICYVNIICHATDVGTATQTLLFEFDGFKIGRRVGVTVRDPSESLLAPQPRADRGRRERARDAQQRFDEKHGGWVVPGQRPLPAKARPFLARLGRWPVPGDLRQGALRGEDPATQRSCLRAPLALRNYGDRFHALLHVEEIVSEMEMRENDLRDATMTRRHDNDTLALAVPGLAEGRPSLMLGDKALVTEGAAGAPAPAYEGYVHAVRQEEVLLAFHPSFQREYAGGPVDVAFVCSRAQTQRHHEAIARAPLVGAAVLFPQRLAVSMPLYVPPPPPPPVRCRRAAPRVRRAEAGLSPGMDDGRTKVMGSPPGIMADGRTKVMGSPPGTADGRTKVMGSPPGIMADGRTKVMGSPPGTADGRTKVMGSPPGTADGRTKVMGSPPGIMADGRTKVMGPGTADGQAEVTWSPPGPVAPAVPDATTAPHSFEFFNAALNSRQRSAVVRMLGAQSRPTPYVLFGPPGTGKTITIVEAMLQVLSRLPSTRILVCTPSNSAADLIVQRLHESGRVTTADMVRYMAFQRSDETVPDDVRDYCVRCDDDALTCAMRRRLVVSTCGSCGTLAALGLSPDHFTHVFVDEAGQATEPETLIPIAMAAPAGGQVVLSGDPMQLGPVLRSPFAKTYGLETSLLERLCQRPLYCRDESRFANHGSYDPLLVTKLVNNYRSHRALLTLPSRLYYDNELVACADTAMADSMCSWHPLPNKQAFPLLFHGVRGQDLREGNSPSWFNPVEAVQVIKYLQALINGHTHPVRADQIGVITPYRKQVEKIRLLMNSFNLDGVKVGSVEEFQGQERLVVILSTVRSTENHVSQDRKHNIGFLGNAKRFNVAVTRAQALLIVVGNPHVLAQDKHWRQLLVYSVENNAYTGCDLPYDLQPSVLSDVNDQEKVAGSGKEKVERRNKEEVEQGEEKVEERNKGKKVEEGNQKKVKMGSQKVEEGNKKKLEIINEENVEGRDKEKVEGRDKEKVEKRGQEKVEERGQEKVEERGQEKVEERGQEKVEERGQEKVEERGQEKVEERGQEKVEERGQEKVEERGEEKVEEELKEDIESRHEEKRTNEICQDHTKEGDVTNEKEHLVGAINTSREQTDVETSSRRRQKPTLAPSTAWKKLTAGRTQEYESIPDGGAITDEQADVVDETGEIFHTFYSHRNHAAPPGGFDSDDDDDVIVESEDEC